ncbi:PhoD-like phosphatase N-terminal domain-containing protein, partial [Akkermansiaceae bacterium]|nr:PhoD-like phosphatase N-terminal domain-containing protein [Akkermansiaceae bacterium]
MTRTLLSFLGLASFTHAGIFLGQGTMSGEATDTSVFLQTRLTLAAELDASGDLPGASGVVAFEWSLNENFEDSSTTPVQKSKDFIVRAKLSELKRHTAYFYRAHYGASETDTKTGATSTF